MRLRTRLRRLGVISLVAAGSMVVAAAPGLADLEMYLEQAETADYNGRQLVVTSWDGNSEIGVFEITHGADMTVRDGGRTSVSPGKVVGAGDGEALVLQGWSRSGLNERYTTATPVPVVRLGRQAESVDVIEDGAVRARIVFDIATRVPLLTEIFDGDGNLFRYSTMLEFEPNPPLNYADLTPSAGDYDVMLPAESSSLPVEAAGYVRADTYAGPDNTIQAFYTDGLFKFSIFEIEGSAALEEFEPATVLAGAGDGYHQLVTPGELWVGWEDGGRTFLLVGDLPPDHLSSVLGELPQPDSGNLLSRLWHGLFG